VRIDEHGSVEDRAKQNAGHELELFSNFNWKFKRNM